MDDLSQQTIIDLYKNPHNKGLLPDATLKYKINNPMCGDQIELTVSVDADGTVIVAGWDGTGCSVSQVGASLLTDYIKNKTLNELKQLNSDEVVHMTGLAMNPTRLRCLLLAFTALQKLIESSS